MTLIHKPIPKSCNLQHGKLKAKTTPFRTRWQPAHLAQHAGTAIKMMANRNLSCGG